MNEDFIFCQFKPKIEKAKNDPPENQIYEELLEKELLVNRNHTIRKKNQNQIQYNHTNKYDEELKFSNNYEYCPHCQKEVFPEKSQVDLRGYKI